MLLQRKYYHDPNGVKSPSVSGVVVKRMPTNGVQHFSPKLVRTGMSERWLIQKDGKITVIDQSGPIVFNIIREPGRYCLHCGVKLSDDPMGKAAQEHISQEHSGIKSPDPLNPSGYVMLTYFETKVEGSNHG